MAKKPDPVPYTAPHDVYVGGMFTKAGDVFVTDADPEDTWVEHGVQDAKIIVASTEQVPPDVSLDDMDVDALKGYAAARNVDTTGMNSKRKLIDAIKAADEPKL